MQRASPVELRAGLEMANRLARAAEKEEQNRG